MQSRYLMLVAGAVVALPLFGAPLFAAGDGGSSEQQPKCTGGQIYNGKTKKCEAPKAGMIDDDSIYKAGRALAMDGKYDDAIKVLTLAADKTDPRILNYLGYSHRKAGRVLVGLGYYQEALRNNPDYTLVREYMGEAHLMLGDVAAARVQLAEIEKRCGKGCREYGMLEEQIESYLRG
ncbi:tetratricopeptide repeat protein [Hoeflea sp. 108]|jgi:tetratricopeptide (TPR) repeat protein|uniref:tetratricopeptide repeat protein n=1 Tax=Hoeflea sp. 108 TaxID=1116369 RepID=UPI0003806AA9|nr:tetratricopeptide repeat protein [Hoeflea sp. 108]